MGWPFDGLRDNGDGTVSIWVDLHAALAGLTCGLLAALAIAAAAYMINRRVRG